MMHFDKALVIEELKKHKDDAKVQKAIAELPDKIDHDEHAHLLRKFGIDPGELAQKAIVKGETNLLGGSRG